MINIKKIYVLIALMLIIQGCKSEKAYNLDDIGIALVNAGATIETDPPLFAAIGATNGVMFYMDDSPVKLYEFENKASLDKALKEYEFLSIAKPKGLIIIDTKSEKAIEVFNGIE